MKAELMAVLVASVVVSPAWSQQSQTGDDRPMITVNGEAVVKVKPDKFIITLGIETWDMDIMVAKQKNNDVAKKAFAAIKECGVSDKDIQTDYLMVEPRYKDAYFRSDLIGYLARQNFVVTLTKTAKLEECITGALRSGVNYVSGIDYQVADFKRYREQARTLALKAAREKAEKMAGVLEQSIGMPVQISENYGGSSDWYYPGSRWNYCHSQGMSQNVIQNSQDGSSDLSDTVALGKISITSRVNVTFELKK